MWKKKVYWTIERSKEEAKKYQHRVDFKNNANRAYTVLRKNGLLDECCSHMTFPDISKFWNKERVIEVAKLCKNKSEFTKKYPGAQRWAKKHNILNEIMKLYTPVGNRYKRCIYSYEFPDNCVYVGLTYNLQKRNKQHMSNSDSKVFQHILLTNIKPKLIQITDYLDYISASEMEGIILKQYIDNNWIPLNAVKTGGLGSIKIKNKKQIKQIHHKLSYEYALECAKKCETKTEFQNNYPSVYYYILKNKLMDKLESEYQFKKIHHKTWTLEECKKVAKQFKTRGEFCNKLNGCYQVVLKNGWINEVCSHMISGKTIKYTEEIVKDEVKKHIKFSEMRNSTDQFIKGCYWWIKKKKLFNEYKQYLKK